jgi:hypothetical protein
VTDFVLFVKLENDCCIVFTYSSYAASGLLDARWTYRHCFDNISIPLKFVHEDLF